jgi:hypothetical protein
MKYQDFLKNYPNPEPYLFTEKEIFILIKTSLGLRLSSNQHEIIHGGHGDAVPLSYLAGAQDILDFVTLACCMLNSTDLADDKIENIRKKLINIYKKYAKYPCSDNSNELNQQYLPGLITTYAKLLSITHSEEVLSSVTRLPEAEEAALLHIYNICGSSVLVLCLFDGRNTCGDMPILKQLLIDNFNQQLFYRLIYNQCFFDKNQMYYFLLQEHTNLFHYSYDLDRYPMGKAGQATFLPENILENISFVPDVTPDLAVRQISGILKWLKSNISKYQENILPDENHTIQKKSINSKNKTAGSCSNFTKTIISIGFFASVTAVSVGVFLNNKYNTPN